MKFDSLPLSIFTVFCLLVNICTKCKPVENPTSRATRQAVLDQFSPLEVSGEFILTGAVARKVISQEYNRCVCRVCELHMFSFYWKSTTKPWKLKAKYRYQAEWKPSSICSCVNLKADTEQTLHDCFQIGNSVMAAQTFWWQMHSHRLDLAAQERVSIL